MHVPIIAFVGLRLRLTLCLLCVNSMVYLK